MAKKTDCNMLLGKRHHYEDNKPPNLLKEARKIGFKPAEIERLRQLYDPRYRRQMQLRQKAQPAE